MSMSVYGAFDYMSVLSRREDPDDDQGRDQETPSEHDDEDDYLLVLDDAAATTVAESADENTTLPSEIHVSSDESRSDSGGGGLTILASLPSHEAAAWQLHQQQLQALSMQVHGAPRNTRNAHSTISLSTTDSHFTDIVHDDDAPSSVSSLSLSVNSLPSSGGFSEEIIFEEDSAMASVASRSTVSKDESTLVKDVKEINPPPLPFLAKFNFGNGNKKGPWYSNLQTEQDWEAFRTECLTLMEAMGEDAPKNADEMLAQLIAQEEEMLYKKPDSSGTFFGLSYETIAMMAGAALVPLVGYALASRSRREKTTA